MQNEDLKPEMKVLVDYDGLKPAKVIGPTTLREGNTEPKITGWVVALERNNLHLTVTADKIHPR